MQNTGIGPCVLHLSKSAFIRSNGRNTPEIIDCHGNQATLLRTFQRAFRFLLPTFLLRRGLAIYVSCRIFLFFKVNVSYDYRILS
jgi:hypothetical protein